MTDTEKACLSIEKIMTNVIVICHNAYGIPDIFQTAIYTDVAGYNDGMHYEIAKNNAEEAGYVHPMVAIDEKDILYKIIFNRLPKNTDRDFVSENTLTNPYLDGEYPEMPMQPVINNRFVPNRLIKDIVKYSKVNLNDVAANAQFYSVTEREQFQQLLDCSLNHFNELDFVRNESTEKASSMSEGLDEVSAENKVLRDKLSIIKKYAKEITTELFMIHEEDLH